MQVSAIDLGSAKIARTIESINTAVISDAIESVARTIADVFMTGKVVERDDD